MRKIITLINRELIPLRFKEKTLINWSEQAEAENHHNLSIEYNKQLLMTIGAITSLETLKRIIDVEHRTKKDITNYY